MCSPKIKPQKPLLPAHLNDGPQLCPDDSRPRSTKPAPLPKRPHSLDIVIDGETHHIWTHDKPIVKSRRNYSWPPALSVEADMQVIPQLEAGDQEHFPELPLFSRRDFDDLSTISSSSPSIRSSSKDNSAAEKAAGLRAAVLEKWAHFVRKSEVLSKSFRHKHHVKSNKHSKSDKRGRPGKADHENKESGHLQNSCNELRELSGVIFSYIEQGMEQDPQRGTVTNSPHELSEVKGVTYHNFDRSIEPDRGRRVFSSTGDIQHAAGPQRQRKSRTASGRRHAWREPGREIYPVMEETDSRSVIKLDMAIGESKRDVA